MELQEIASDLDEWYRRAKATNAIFDSMTGDAIERRERYKARSTIADVIRQLTFLARGIDIDYDEVDPNLYLPEASYAEWAAIFQNIFTNAFNALQQSDRRYVRVESRRSGMDRSIIILDTGQGVDLDRAVEYFEPFRRGIETPGHRTALGYGGTGLGLTIVRLLCGRIGCLARFIEPDEGFNTAFSLEWRESPSRRRGQDVQEKAN